MEHHQRLAILVGGGPAPGINSVIAAATIRARLEGLDVVGIRDGFEWLMQGDVEHVTPLTIYCMTGHMSAIAGQTLTGLGYTDIVELDGGMEAWQVMGQPFIPAGG